MIDSLLSTLKVDRWKSWPPNLNLRSKLARSFFQFFNQTYCDTL